jgi:hypothetical protein
LGAKLIGSEKPGIKLGGDGTSTGNGVGVGAGPETGISVSAVGGADSVGVLTVQR